MVKLTQRPRWFMFFAGAIGLAGLLLQAALSYRLSFLKGWGVVGATAGFLGHFTVLINALIVICYHAEIVAPGSLTARFFVRKGSRTGLLLYSLFVAVVYGTVLNELWKPYGVQLFADSVLNYLTPLLYLLFWIFYVPRETLPWVLALEWLGLPVAFFAWILLSGLITHNYPYPFLDVNQLGYARVFANSGVLAVAFLAGGLVLIAVARLTAPKPATAPGK